MSQEQQLLIVWLTFAVLGGAAAILVLVWAVRTGQFAHQDRARHLPLEAGIPGEDTTTKASPRGAGGLKDKASPHDASGSTPATDGKGA